MTHFIVRLATDILEGGGTSYTVNQDKPQLHGDSPLSRRLQSMQTGQNQPEYKLMGHGSNALPMVFLSKTPMLIPLSRCVQFGIPLLHDASTINKDLVFFSELSQENRGFIGINKQAANYASKSKVIEDSEINVAGDEFTQKQITNRQVAKKNPDLWRKMLQAKDIPVIYISAVPKYRPVEIQGGYPCYENLPIQTIICPTENMGFMMTLIQESKKAINIVASDDLFSNFSYDSNIIFKNGFEYKDWLNLTTSIQ